MTLTATNLMTAEMLEVMPHNGKRLELIRGELKEYMPTGGEHGICTHRLSARLGVFVEDHQLGEVFAAETGFIVDRNPDSVRAPDIAYMSFERLGQLDHVPKGFLPIAPDLVAETISPFDLYSQSHEKALMWLEFGVRVVLLLDPRKANITIYRSKRDISVLESADTLEFDDVVSGFRISVAQIFKV